MGKDKMSECDIISVTGIGKASVEPDTVRLSITLTGLHPTYAESLSAWDNANAELLNKLGMAGFAKSKLRTAAQSIDPRYDYTGEGAPKLVGYEYRHTFELTFPVKSHAKLAKALDAVSEIDGQAHTDISYEVSDRENITNKLIAAAVSDAKSKAELIADAAGVKLGGISEIVYTEGASNGGVMLMRSMKTADISPKSVEMSESVIVKFHIEQ